MSTKIKIRRDTLNNWQQYNPVLDDGELGIIKDNGQMKVGDGLNRFMELPVINNSFNGYTWELIGEQWVDNGHLNLTINKSDISGDFLICEVNLTKRVNDDNNFYLRFDTDYDAPSIWSKLYHIYDSGVNFESLPSSNLLGKAETNLAGSLMIYLNNGYDILVKGEFVRHDVSSRSGMLKTGHYRYGGNDFSYITLYTDAASGVNIDKGYVKIYKLTHIVAESPYKKLVASASNVNQLNGMIINVNQDKKYEIEFEYNNQVSSHVYFLINNDTDTSNYDGEGFQYRKDGNSNYSTNGCYIAFSNDLFGCREIKIFPFSNSVKNNFKGVNTLGSFTNFESGYYKNGQINTLNIVAPNDDIPCKFKVWEITE